MRRTFIAVLLLCGLACTAQVKIGENNININTNSLLELESTTKGLLLPRLTYQQIQAMSGVPTGMLVFNSTDSALYLRRDTGWAVLALAPNAQSSTNPWVTNGGTLYNLSAAKVGVSTPNPISQLSNTANNILAPDGYGSGARSIAWEGFQQGYIAQLYNAGMINNANGLLVKVGSNSSNNIALSVSQGYPASATGTSLLTVKADGKTGINNSAPAQALDVTGNIAYSGTLLMGVQYIVSEGFDIPGTGFGQLTKACPVGTKLIGGGGGHRDYSSSTQDININYSGPDPNNPIQWRLNVKNNAPTPRTVIIYSICAKVQ